MIHNWLKNHGRGARPDWDCTFMSIARTIAKRSLDPNTQVGAVIVDSRNRVISLGYNGMPAGMELSDVDIKKKNDYMIHAEKNALLQVDDRSRLQGGKCYVTLYPCPVCTQALCQVGIKEIIYNEYRDYEASRIIFDACGVKVRKY